MFINIFSLDKISPSGTGIMTINATQVNDSSTSYTLQMKNCNNAFFVYRLQPTKEQSGYCFGNDFCYSYVLIEITFTVCSKIMLMLYNACIGITAKSVNF